MHKPSKKILYILIACIISLILISLTKNLTSVKTGQLSLETSSGTAVPSGDQSNEDLSQTNNSSSTGTTITGDENLTQSLGQTLFSKYYSSADSQGGSLSDADSQDLVQQAATAAASINLEKTQHFSFQDLKINKSSNQNLKDFANNFASKEDSLFTNIQKVAEATQDPAIAGQLYRDASVQLSKVPITQEISQPFLAILNSIYLLGERTTAMGVAKDDPLKQLVILKDITTIQNEEKTGYKEISDLIKSSGIIFSNNEPGQIWLGNVQ